MFPQYCAPLNPEESAMAMRVRLIGSEGVSSQAFSCNDESTCSYNRDFEAPSVWDDEHSYTTNTGTIPIDPNMTGEEKFALGCLLGECITEVPEQSQPSKGDSEGFTESEQFALDMLLAPKQKTQQPQQQQQRRRSSKWLKRCWKSVRSLSSKKDAATAA